jgi:signal transduction histidine kinase
MADSAENTNVALAGDFIVKILSGAMRGTKIPVRKTIFTLGRSAESDVHVHDTLISRIHCRLLYENGKWFVEDLNSTNGTWILGQRVIKKSFLPLRTSVRIGKTSFEINDVFSGDKTGVYTKSSISCRIQPETLAAPQPLGETPAAGPRMVKEENLRLASVYKFQNIISTIFESKDTDLHSQILNAVCNVMPADKAYILLFDLETGEFLPKHGRAQGKMMEKADRSEINQTLVSFVRDNRESVLSVDKYNDGNPPLIPELQDLTQSSMCVPMLGKQQINGMIYLTLISPSEKYTEDDLRLLTVLGHTSGMAVEYNNMLEASMKNERLVATGTTAASLSHYVKNILAGLDGSLSLLKMGIDEKDLNLADESWGILNKNHRRLALVVMDLLNLASELKPNLNIENVNDIIRDVYELMRPQLSQDGIELETDKKTADLPLFAEVDSKGIHRILLNLLLNAEHAILERRSSINGTGGQVLGRIHISANFNENKDYVIVSVTDDGVGIDKEDMKKLFSLFITSKGNAGTGLGLAVTKRLVESHGGSIQALSEKGKGSTFVFSLPVAHNEMNTTTRTIKRFV